MKVPDHMTAEVPTAGAVPVAVVAVEAVDDAVAARRFCRACGTAWDPAEGPCPACDRQARRAAVLLAAAPESRRFQSALWFYFALLGVCAAGMVAFLAGAGKHDGGLTVELAEIVGLSVVTAVWAATDGREVGPPLARVPGVGWFAAAVGLSVVTVAIATGTIGSFRSVTHMPAERMSEPFLAAGWGWGFIVLCTCVQPAVIEELAFRGVIFAGVGRVLSRTETVFVTALMFMVLHLSPVRFPHTLALGLGTGYLRLRTGSLYPSMAMHFAHNLLCVGGERFDWF